VVEALVTGNAERGKKRRRAAFYQGRANLGAFILHLVVCFTEVTAEGEGKGREFYFHRWGHEGGRRLLTKKGPR